MWRSVTFLLFCFATTNGSTKAVVTQKCYVCVPSGGSEEIKSQFPDEERLPYCSTGKEEVKICPPDHNGCLTQYKLQDPSRLTKGCTKVNTTSCHTANQIRYCFCSGDLCNIKAITDLQEEQDETLSDDEDINEGSGNKSNLLLDETTTTNPPTTPTTTTRHRLNPVTTTSTESPQGRSRSSLNTNWSIITLLPILMPKLW